MYALSITELYPYKWLRWQIRCYVTSNGFTFSVQFGLRMQGAISDAQKPMSFRHHTCLTAEAGLSFNLTQAKNLIPAPHRDRSLKRYTRKHRAHTWPMHWPELLAAVGAARDQAAHSASGHRDDNTDLRRSWGRGVLANNTTVTG